MVHSIIITILSPLSTLGFALDVPSAGLSTRIKAGVHRYRLSWDRDMINSRKRDSEHWFSPVPTIDSLLDFARWEKSVWKGEDGLKYQVIGRKCQKVRSLLGVPVLGQEWESVTTFWLLVVLEKSRALAVCDENSFMFAGICRVPTTVRGLLEL